MAFPEQMFTKSDITKVYNYTKSEAKTKKKRRRVIANLLMGEWVLALKKYGKNYFVAVRGGKGYVAASDLRKKRLLEVYFIDVGQGDAILIQTPNDRRILVDGGRDNEAHSFLKWKYNLIKKTNEIEFDAVVMTHADIDHAGGLRSILGDPQISVKTFYHNGIARFKNKPKIGKITGKSPNRKLKELYDDVTTIKEDKLSRDYKRLVKNIKKAKKKNSKLKVKRLDQFSKELSEFDADNLTIKVLGPLNQGTKNNPHLSAIGSERQIINGNSVGLMLEYGKCKILLCGDMNEAYEKEFLKKYSGSKLKANVFKANHHGSMDFSDEFLKSVQPWVSVVSSGDEPDYGHPRAGLLGSLGYYSSDDVEIPLIFSTEIARTFKEIKDKELKNTKGKPFYEKAIKGIIHVRTDGNTLVAGRIFGHPTLADPDNHNGYQWEYYSMNLS